MTFLATKPIVHVTSVYMGRITDNEKRKTAANNLRKHIGVIDSMDVTAVVFTKRTISARVRLHRQARPYYFNDAGGPGEAHTDKQGYKPSTSHNMSALRIPNCIVRCTSEKVIQLSILVLFINITFGFGRFYEPVVASLGTKLTAYVRVWLVTHHKQPNEWAQLPLAQCLGSP